MARFYDVSLAIKEGVIVFYVTYKFGLLDKTDAVRESTVDAHGTTVAVSPYMGKGVTGIIVPADLPVKLMGEINIKMRRVFASPLTVKVTT